MTRARVSEGLLAALGTLAATWPLTTLLQGSDWLWRLVWLVLLVAAVGMLARRAGARNGFTVTAQAITLLAVVAALDVRAPLGLRPIAEQVWQLITAARHTIITNAAPAPVGPGLLFALSLVVPALGIAVDFLATGARRPALAGIPLLGVFMLSASNTDGGLNPAYFVAIAIIWLAMVAHGHGRQMRSWASSYASASTPTRFQARFNVSQHASVARALGVVALAAALALPAMLPHGSPVILGEGLRRAGATGGPTTLFATDEDIAKDLHHQGGGPVLTYRTDDPEPPPLQVLSTSVYHDGHWQLTAGTSGLVPGVNGASLAVDPGVVAPTAQYTMRVSHNNLRSPQLAAPYPTRRADLGAVPWKADPFTGRLVPSGRVHSYVVTYGRLQDDAHPSGRGEATGFPEGLTALPSASADRLRALARAIGGGSPFNEAIAIQDYLRGGAFTYSLRLAATRKGPDGKPLDPLSNFLVTKRGYCIQFATAMVMLARADGIPARFAVGFLPGTQSASGVYKVVRSDAHAWPELWFPGTGWTRFEPTPGERSGAPPLYAIPTTTDPVVSSVTGPSVAAPQIRQHAAPPPVAGVRPRTTGGHAGGVSDWWLLWPAAAILLLLLVIGIIPGVAAWRRRRWLAAARHGVPLAEARWTVLASRLDDLGISPVRGRSPRAALDYYRRSGRFDDPAGGTDALARVVATIERERYAPPEQRQEIAWGADAASVIHAVRRNSSWRRRLVAVLFPATGRRVLRGALSLRSWRRGSRSRSATGHRR